MKPLLFVIPLSLLFACTNRAPEFQGLERFESNDLVTDTLFLFNPPSADSITSSLPTVIIVPKTTKVVKWFSIGYMPDGSGLLKVTTEDNSNYEVKLKNSTVVAATGNLMQNAYVRLDTVTKEIYSYKAAISATLKPF